MSRFSPQQPHTISLPSKNASKSASTDPHKTIKMVDVVIVEPDLDRVCRLLLASERSLALVNRRALAATLANVPPAPGQVLPPAPPFAEAVAIAREDGQLVERTRLFLATHPRAIEELTPELTRTLVHIFDPTGRTARLRRRRASYLMPIAAGISLLGAITLLVSATLLVEHMMTDSQRMHALANHSSITSSKLDHVALFPMQFPTRFGAAHNDHAATLSVNGASPATKNSKTSAKAGKHPVVAKTTTLATKTALVSMPVDKAAKATGQLGQPKAAIVASSISKAPIANHAATAPTTTATAAVTKPTLVDATTKVAATATQPSASTASPVAQATGSSASASPQASTDAATQHQVTASFSTANGTKVVQYLGAQPQTTIASPDAASAKTGWAISNTATPAAGSSSREDAAQSFVTSAVIAQNPAAHITSIHSSHVSADVISVHASVRNNDTSSVVDYTLKDSGTGFTVLNQH